VALPTPIQSDYRSNLIRSLNRRFLKNFRRTYSIRRSIQAPPFYSGRLCRPRPYSGVLHLVESVGSMQTCLLQFPKQNGHPIGFRGLCIYLLFSEVIHAANDSHTSHCHTI
jgi:hypothetical protein